MAREKKRSLVSARTFGMVIVALIFVVIGVFIGMEIGGVKVGDQRQQIESCLPIASSAQLDYCLSGGGE